MGRLLAEPLAGDNAPALSVGELAGRVKRHVEAGFGLVRVRGEISGWKRHSSGHCYCTLKDDVACIDAVVWKTAAARLAFTPADGAEVIATGKLTTYPGRSKYQIVIDTLTLAGTGALLALFEQLKAKLAGEGLFDTANKRALPFVPRTIGVVTSPTGAVIRDILHRLADRFPCEVVVWPVAVQGPGAADAIAAAVAGFSAGGPHPRPDLLIVARGGGSIEDLWPFNEEVVARAIAASRIPTISAVGHETDTSLSDFAADWRAPTPTAAAERAVPVLAELALQLRSLGARAGRAATRDQQRAAERFAHVVQRWPDPDELYAPQRQRLDDTGERLRRALERRTLRASAQLADIGGGLRIAALTTRLTQARARLERVALLPRLLERPLAQAGTRLDQVARTLSVLHPDAPLARGYARVMRRDGTVVTTAVAARRAGALRIAFADGDVAARVERTAPRPYRSGVQSTLFGDSE